ncbi:hypothetical protein MSMTP_0651 [Methanosarcina sp. MTP4]|uniref:hypothetical protein n=1 Tax=Methanosarcina sp. MTP4 TaxID=1434100 RepID=UPI0006160350|nr:hypothetical protein [Methanosarcina sp. MTP4]AKB24120.1 hypothetical protein MSMTP_0651 [Methanosarcina sp. MTP4]
MGIFSKLFGSKDPIDSMKTEELRVMEIKLNRKIEDLQAEVRATESEVAKLFEKAKAAKSKSEELTLARRIKTVSQRKEMKIAAQAKLDKELRAVSNMLILKEHQADLQATGVWDKVKKLEPEKLENWLVNQNLEAQDRDEIVSSIIDMTSTAMLTGVEQEDDLDDILSAIHAVKEGDLDPEEAEEVVNDNKEYRPKDLE